MPNNSNFMFAYTYIVKIWYTDKTYLENIAASTEGTREYKLNVQMKHEDRAKPDDAGQTKQLIDDWLSQALNHCCTFMQDGWNSRTRLYHSGVDKQLVMETTGYCSTEGVRTYKRTSTAQRETVSDILSCAKKLCVEPSFFISRTHLYSRYFNGQL